MIGPCNAPNDRRRAIRADGPPAGQRPVAAEAWGLQRGLQRVDDSPPDSQPPGGEEET